MMRGIAFLIVLASSAGCAAERYANLDCDCRRDAPPVWEISLTAPSSQWIVSVHTGYSETQELYSIVLPSRPRSQRYEFSEIRLSELDSANGISVLAGGYVAVDLERREVVVSLQTEQGQFRRNGTYPIRYVSGAF
jgi:hypothetical protein